MIPIVVAGMVGGLLTFAAALPHGFLFALAASPWGGTGMAVLAMGLIAYRRSKSPAASAGIDWMAQETAQAVPVRKSVANP